MVEQQTEPLGKRSQKNINSSESWDIYKNSIANCFKEIRQTKSKLWTTFSERIVDSGAREHKILRKSHNNKMGLY